MTGGHVGQGNVGVGGGGQLGQETGGHIGQGNVGVGGVGQLEQETGGIGHVTNRGHWIGVGGVSVGQAP